MIYSGKENIALPLRKINIWEFKDEELKEALYFKMNKFLFYQRNINEQFYDEDEELINIHNTIFLDMEELVNLTIYTNEMDKEFNRMVEKIIINNSDEFRSIYQYIQDINSIITDAGVYKIFENISLGINDLNYFDVKIEKLKIKDIIKLLYIDYDGANETNKILTLINLYLLVNKEKQIIIRINKIDDAIYNWLDKIYQKNNIILIIDNECISKMNLAIVKFNVSFSYIYDNKFQEYEIHTENELNYYSFIFSKKVRNNSNYVCKNIKNKNNKIKNTEIK